jgi:MarR family transcriptional regulator, organic hydroperoxide resistance regulator
MLSVSGPKSRQAKAPAPQGETAREAWSLLASLVYPPPFLGIARELGLRPASFGALRALDRPRTMSEIATVLHCDNSNVTGIVDGLEERGLAARRPSEADRRVKRIELTAEGRRVRARLTRAVAKPPAWVEGLSEADRRALAEILGRAAGAGSARG